MITRHLLPFLFAILLFSSCSSHTIEEKQAIQYIIDHCKSPSSFKLIDVESNYRDDPEYTEIDTVYYLKGKNKYHTRKSALQPMYKKPSVETFKYDSIGYFCRIKPAKKYTWVDVSFEAKNAYGTPIKKNEIVIIYNDRPWAFIDFVDFDTREERLPGIKLKKPEKLTRSVYDFVIF